MTTFDPDLWKHLCNRRSDIRLRALMNRMYYQERQRIFESREGLVKVISLFAGSAALVKVADPDIVQWCAVAITASSITSLVFGFGTKARDSAKRSSEWAMMERDIEARGERGFTEADLDMWCARCNEIESSEPAAHPGLLERCYIRACETLGSKPSPASFWRRHRPAIFIH